MKWCSSGQTNCTTIWRAPCWCVPARSSLFSLWGQVCLILHAGYYRRAPSQVSDAVVSVVGSDLSPVSSLGPVSHNQTMAGLSTPSPAPGGLSQQLYGTSARHGCPRRTTPLFECRMSVLMLDRGTFPCWISMSVAAGWRKTSFLSVVLSKALFLSKPVPFLDTVTFPLCKLICSQAVPYCLSCLMSNKSLIVPSWQNW